MTEDLPKTSYARNPLEVAKERHERHRKEFQRCFPHYLPPEGKDGAQPTAWELAQFAAWETAQDIKEGMEYVLRLMAMPDFSKGEVVAAIEALQTMLRNSENIPTDLDAEIKEKLKASRDEAKKVIFEWNNPTFLDILEPSRKLASLPPAPANGNGTALAIVPQPWMEKPSAPRAWLPYDKASRLFPRMVMAPYQTEIGRAWTEKGLDVKLALLRDRPDPWEFRLDELDTIIVNIVQGLWVKNGCHQFEVTVNEIARLAFGMEPGADVHESRRDEVQKRIAYMAGCSPAPNPANLKMYSEVGKNDPNRGIKNIFHGAFPRGDGATWVFTDSPEPSKLASKVKRIGHTRADLLTCGINAARLLQGKGEKARVSYTNARAALASWLRRRLEVYQGMELEKENSDAQAAEDAQKNSKTANQEKTAPTAEPKHPEPRTIFLAKMLADTWEAAALPIPKNGGGYYRTALARRIETVKDIMMDLKNIGAITDFDFQPNVPPPAEIVQAAQRWAAANAPDTDGQWMAPKGAFTVMGPFNIRIIDARKTPQLLPGSKRRGRPPKKTD